MKLKPTKKYKNPNTRNKVISFRVSNDDLSNLETIKLLYGDSSDGEIVRMSLGLAATETRKEIERTKK